MPKKNTVATNARISAQADKVKFNKKSLLGKVLHLTTNVLYWTSDSSHAALSGANSLMINGEMKIAGSNENMNAYVQKKNRDLAKKGLFGMLWSLVSGLFVSNKRSRYIGAYSNEKVQDTFFKDCIAQWSVAATSDEKKDMKIILKLLKSDNINRKFVVNQVEEDFMNNGYPDVHAFFIQSEIDLADRIKMYKLETEAAKENSKH